jgi:hypothetical protein
MRVAIGSDHPDFVLKEELKELLGVFRPQDTANGAGPDTNSPRSLNPAFHRGPRRVGSTSVPHARALYSCDPPSGSLDECLGEQGRQLCP